MMQEAHARVSAVAPMSHAGEVHGDLSNGQVAPAGQPGRRKAWSREERIRIVRESVDSGLSVARIAEKYGVSRKQLFEWRRKFSQKSRDDNGMASPSAGGSVIFAPVVLDEAVDENEINRDAGRCQVEVVFGSAVVRIAGDVSAELLVKVFQAVKAVS